MSLTRAQNAEAVLAHLRGVVPAYGGQSVEDIRTSLGMPKRQVEDALWLLANQGRVEYAGQGAPLTYKASGVAAMQEP